MTGFDYDLFVIGGGSGGVRAARASAGYGARVAVAEEYRLGGTCVVRGCVPKKLLAYGAAFAQDLEAAGRFGWRTGTVAFDWSTLRDNVAAEVDRLTHIYQDGLDQQGVTIFAERAVVSGPNAVTLASGRKISARHILVATGARPMVPGIPGSEHGMTSNEIFSLSELPRHVLIAGGGYIANEFAGIFRSFGSSVTLVNRGDTILRGYDEQIRDRLLQISLARGIDFRFHAEIEAIEKLRDGALRISMSGHRPIDVDLLLFATGRSPNTANLGLDAAGVELDAKGAIVVDADNRSSVSSIFAVGDVTNRIQLTPVAIREGQAFADGMFGGKRHRIDYQNVPSAVFSQPPIAGVGMTEAEARDRLASITVHLSDFRPMRGAFVGRDERALYKMICDAETGRVVGLHMIGPEAPEILQMAAVAVRAGLTKADFDATVALHPTMAEELVLLK